MVYHLKNKMSLELAKTEPQMFVDIVSDLLKGKQIIPDPSEVRPKIKNFIEGCNKANTLEGFEACIMANIESIHPVFKKGEGYWEVRENVFNVIDEAGDAYDYLYKEHRL